MIKQISDLRTIGLRGRWYNCHDSPTLFHPAAHFLGHDVNKVSVCHLASLVAESENREADADNSGGQTETHGGIAAVVLQSCF
jgi:hypothetical protein